VEALTEINLAEKKPDYRGKVRDIYDLGDTLVLTASDRLSAFDVVFDQGIPERGKILTRISNHWFKVFHEIKNHIIETNVEKFPPPFSNYKEELGERSVWVKKAQRIDFECVVRGYLLGSGYKEYTETGSVCGVKLPDGLKKSEKLPSPIFTPATKVDKGHDENVSFEYMKEKIGAELAEKLRDLSINIYTKGYKKLLEQGILLADTKLEFGLLDDEIILIDEILTPDSSRFFKADEYEKCAAEGVNPPSLDKQIVRDYLETLDWNKQPPAPKLPQEIINKTKEKYLEIEKIVLCVSQG